MDESLKKFIEGMPKIELHLHLEGSLEPELLVKLAKRNGITLATTDLAALKKAYKKDGGRYASLDDFLAPYYQGMSVLKTEQDFYDLTMAYLQKVATQNVKHVEVFFDPQEHTARGVAYETALNGIHRALKDGEKNLNISSKLIMSFVRHRSEEEAFQIFEEAKKPENLKKINGFGLDSSELEFPPRLFERVFAEARKTGLPVLAHAGEEGPPEYVTETLDLLKVSRIDHGNRSLEDAALTQRLADMKMGLTVCPLSNLKLNGVKDYDMKNHPLKKILDSGLKAGINSDDPAYFDGYMNENFFAVADALNLTRKDIVKLAENAIETSFLSPEMKEFRKEELDSYVRRFEAAEKHVNSAVGSQRGVG